MEAIMEKKVIFILKMLLYTKELYHLLIRCYYYDQLVKFYSV